MCYNPSSKEYKKKLCQEAEFWGAVSKSKKDNLIRKILKNILKSIGIYSPIEENPGVDFRNEILFKAMSVIWGKKEINTIAGIASRGKKILELGCGKGWLSIEIAKRNKNVEIDAVDISAKAIEKGLSFYNNNKSELGKINFLVKDLNRVKLKKEYYDVVIAFGTLHHITRLKILLKKLCDSLKHRGYLVAYEDNGLCEKDRDRLIILLYPFLLLRNIIRKKPLGIDMLRRDVEKMYEWSEIRKSPFEGVVKGKEIIIPLSKNFRILHIKNLRCMIDGVLRSSPMPILRLFSTPLKILDNFLLFVGVLYEGRNVFIIAKKK